jgi:streptomycin 6-kinase
MRQDGRMREVDIPAALARNAVTAWGEAGRAYLAALPATVAALAREWDLAVAPAYPLSYHWVAPVTRADGGAAVLKVGVAGAAGLTREAGVLSTFDGRGAVRLLAHDPDRGALLLERADPGTPAAALVPADDAAATAAVAAVARRMHEPPPPGCALPDLSSELADFAAHRTRDPHGRRIPTGLVARAEGLMRELCASTTDQVLLHGDLHHDNVLAASREPWLAIDPRGYVGDAAFDCSPMLYNPGLQRRDEQLTALVPARVEQLADLLDLPRERVHAWGFVMAVLSEVWTAEAPDEPPTRALDVAHLLAAGLA